MFLEKNNPDLQLNIIFDQEKAIRSTISPALSVIDAIYGRGSSIKWIIPQLENLCQFSGIKDKLNEFQYKEIAILIRQRYYYLKVSEMLLFFAKLKCGDFGQFYGSIDGMKIISALSKFVAWRNAKIDEYESEVAVRAEVDRRSSEKTMTRDEYDEIKGTVDMWNLFMVPKYWNR